MRLLTRGSLVISLIIAGSLSGQTQLPRDDAQSIEGLPPEAPRTGTVITIDVSLNRLYLFRDGQLVKESPAATGSEKVLKQGRHVWLFRTPEGHLTVLRKIEDPVWTKPDWAFVEDGERVPPLNSPKRKVKGHLGRYALDLGEGIMIHGTDESRSIGRKMSHGCIRLPNDMLKTVYRSAAIGTDVYIFESQIPQTATKRDRHSDLDF
jgi:L,D-transpeptidase ErfK/SrfK